MTTIEQEYQNAQKRLDELNSRFTEVNTQIVGLTSEITELKLQKKEDKKRLKNENLFFASITLLKPVQDVIRAKNKTLSKLQRDEFVLNQKIIHQKEVVAKKKATYEEEKRKLENPDIYFKEEMLKIERERLEVEKEANRKSNIPEIIQI